MSCTQFTQSCAFTYSLPFPLRTIVSSLSLSLSLLVTLRCLIINIGSSGLCHPRGTMMKGRERARRVLEKAVMVWVFLVVGGFMMGLASGQALSTSFYDGSCPSMKSVLANAVAVRLQQDRSVAGPLLRLFFHDCFVEGCDASVLIKSTAGNSAERDSAPNQTIRELGLIDAIKVQLEKVCPGVVSCADIVALAAKEAVVQSGGPDWEVELGRRDGRISRAFQAATNLPSSLSSLPSLIQSFSSKGLSIRDLVTLSGAHSIGNGHCLQASRRIYGFNNSNGIDPTMDISFAQKLQKIFPLPIPSQSRVPLDMTTPTLFDNMYYQDLLQKKGLFTSDSSLLADASTLNIVIEYAKDEHSFFTNFAKSMLSMGRIGVLTQGKGEIRRHCAAINK